MAKENDTLFCDGCGVEIECQPLILGRGYFCCADCSEGLACSCGERMEEEDRRTPYPAVPA
jgi:hypothetical protein